MRCPSKNARAGYNQLINHASGETMKILGENEVANNIAGEGSIVWPCIYIMYL